MALSPRLTVATQNFNMNASLLKQGLAGLSDREWCLRPNDSTNNMLWLVGHMTWARTMVMRRLGDHWTTPWMQLYARGQKCVESPNAPTPKALMEAWDETCTRLNRALESASEEVLDTPASQPGPPSADGKLCGTINFMVLHETYHLGQASYLRAWMGKAGLMG